MAGKKRQTTSRSKSIEPKRKRAKVDTTTTTTTTTGKTRSARKRLSTTQVKKSSKKTIATTTTDSDSDSASASDNTASTSIKGPVMSCRRSIYRNPNTSRMYFETCNNIKVPFERYRKSELPPLIETYTTTTKNKGKGKSKGKAAQLQTQLPYKTFNVSVGDAIIIHVDEGVASPPPKRLRGRNGKEKWFPFRVPWTTCEILAIYQDQVRSSSTTTTNKKNNNKNKKQTKKNTTKQTEVITKFIIRYFNRTAEMSVKEVKRIDVVDVTNNNNNNNVSATPPTKKDTSIDDVYETDEVYEIYSHSILGKAYIVLPGGVGHANVNTNANANTNTNINNTNNTNTNTIASKIMKEQQQMKKDGIIYIRQNCSKFLLLVNKREYSIISKINGKCHFDNEIDNKLITKRLSKVLMDMKMDMEMEMETEIEGSSSVANNNNIMSRSRSSNAHDLFWLYRCCRGLQCLLNWKDKDIKFMKDNDNFIKGTLDAICRRTMLNQDEDVDEDVDGDVDEDVDAKMNIDAMINDTNSEEESESSSSVFGNADDSDQDNNDDNDDNDSSDEIVDDTITTKSNKKDNDTKKQRRQSTPSSADTSDDDEISQITTAMASSLPFHVDVSALKAFYKEISMDIPFDAYMEPYNKSHIYNIDDRNKKWSISIGDTVAIHVDKESFKERGGGSFKQGNYTFPYVVPWWTGEVVSVFLNLDSHKEALNLRKDVLANNNRKTRRLRRGREGAFHLEIRWFYKKCDIPGNETLKSSINAPNGTEEIFETDSITEIELSSLLGRVSLFSDPNMKKENFTKCFGLPVVNFFCHQLWSVHRKSLMPIGSAENRVQRGMLYSKYMGRDSATRVAHSRRDTSAVADRSKIPRFEQKYDWKKPFHDTISKLTLAESSQIGNANEHNIIGREAERKQISHFLKSAIQIANVKQTSDQDEINSNLLVLFIGGAPGTGKTASVKSIIYHFNQEQAEGKIPSFHFVSVNGMEMRHPFDVYIRLWEAISNRNEICPAEEALAKLDLHFGGNPHLKTQKSTGKRDVVVLMVDEIDYLVTKKQTVLYNLFDWPSRGYSAKSPAQLIVVGISNTLNLPERLHSRLKSRIGRERCMYACYSIGESMSILEGKLGITDTKKSIFHADAIKFAARKISSESGDIRKVFHLCKVAAENVYNDIESGSRKLPVTAQPHLGIVGIGAIQKASRKIFNSGIHQGISDATDMEALLFVCLASLKRQREYGGFGIHEVVTKMEGTSSAFGDERYTPSPTSSELLRMLNRLGEARIVSLQTANGRHGNYGTNGANGAFNTMVSLEVDSYEILIALKDTCHKKLAERFLSGNLFGKISSN